jgi:3-deoxy-manno-octulosonate cytidylyltransferase (CMP-KDO synthetase)
MSGTDRINEIALLKEWEDDVIVLNVQGEEPLIPHQLISNLAEFARSNFDFSITTAVSLIKTQANYVNPNVVKAILGEESRALYFTRSSAPFNRSEPKGHSQAYRNIGIYAYCVGALKKFFHPSSQYWSHMKKLNN